MSGRIIAGIDPGVKTGVALWNCSEQQFDIIATRGIVEVMELLRHKRKQTVKRLQKIYFEDARLRKWYGKADRERLQGAGSIKRDSSIWQEFCEYYKITFEAVRPVKGQTKWDSKYFKRLTGWQGRTSQHARDAAALVFGMKQKGFNSDSYCRPLPDVSSYACKIDENKPIEEFF